MAIYRVLLPVGASDQAVIAERAKFLREGFCWPAFVFGPFWLLARGLWRPLLVWCLGAALVGLAISYGRLSAAAPVWLYLLSALFLGLEGRSFLAAAIERAGFSFVAVAAGDDRLAAERSFFSRWLAQPAPAPTVARPHTPIAPAHVIGLFPESGG
jgi:Protein of unknown function (DUF2628)